MRRLFVAVLAAGLLLAAANPSLEPRVSALEVKVADLQARVTALEAKPSPIPTPTPTPTSVPTPTPSPTPTPTPTATLPPRPFPAPVTTQTVNVPTTIDSTGASDAYPALQSFINGTLNGSVIVFRTGTYRLDTGLDLRGRHNLVFEGNGATLRSTGDGSSMWKSNFVTYGGLADTTDIVIRNFIIEGTNPRIGNDIYDPSHEAQHAVGIYGGSRIEVAGNTIRKTYGDGVYVANGTTSEWVDGVWVHDNTFRYIGRIVLTVNAGRNVLFEHNDADIIGGSLLDIEPDLDSQGADNVTVRNNTNGTWGMTNTGTSYWAASANQSVAPNSAVNNVTISGNTSGPPSAGGMSAAFGGLATWFGKPTYRMKNITVTGNTTTKAGSGPVFKFEHIDGLTYYANSQPLTSGSLAYVNDCTNIVTVP